MENTGQQSPSPAQSVASIASNTSVRVYQDPSAPMPLDVPENDPQTKVKHLNAESEPLPPVSPEFQSAFQDIFQEVFEGQETAVKEEAQEAEEKRQKEIEAVESKLHDIASTQGAQPSPAVNATPVVSAPVPSPQSQTKAQQVMQALGKKPNVSNSLTWLATLFSKVFKIRRNTDE